MFVTERLIMSESDKTTIKLRVSPDKMTGNTPESNLTADQNNALELAKKTTQLEEEKKKAQAYLATIEQLRESLKQEQAKTAEMANLAVGLEHKLKEVAELESKVKKVAELETRVKELTELLDKISGIAAGGDLNQNQL